MSTEKGPYGIDVTEGQTYAWCACGLSQNQPLCDGAHKNASDKRSLKWVSQKTERIAMCGCKQTKNPPFCDGSHVFI